MAVKTTILYQSAKISTEETKKQGKKIAALTGVEEKLLFEMYRFDFLTVRQVQRLFYSPKTRNYAGERLRALVTKGYAEVYYLPRRTKAGSAPAVFRPSKRGAAHCHRQGQPPCKRLSPSEVQSLGYIFWFHTLAVNDVLFSARTLEKLAPGYTLVRFEHDNELKEEPVYVAGDTSEKKIGVVPDLWLHFTLPLHDGQTNPLHIALTIELDRGTNSRKRIKEKLKALLKYIDGPYQERFHTDSVTICFATPHGNTRMKWLRSLCEEVLSEADRKADAQFFFFTTLPEPKTDLNHDIDPLTLWLSPVWYVPFSNDPKTVLSP